MQKHFVIVKTAKTDKLSEHLSLNWCLIFMYLLIGALYGTLEWN